MTAGAGETLPDGVTLGRPVRPTGWTPVMYRPNGWAALAVIGEIGYSAAGRWHVRGYAPAEHSTRADAAAFVLTEHLAKGTA